MAFAPWRRWLHAPSTRSGHRTRYRPRLLPLEERLVLSPPGSGWQLIWSDEFNGTSLDTNKWTIATGTRRDAVNAASAVGEGGGYLTITTYTSGGTNYTGFIGTNNHFYSAYGYWEARINFQGSPGMWSAFWIQSPTIGNPMGNPAVAGTEIDVVEHRHSDQSGTNISNKAESNLHWDGYGSNEHSAGSGLENNPGSTPLEGNFHLYGIQWTPAGYQFYIDGTQVWSSTQGVSHRTEYIYLTSEVQNNSWAGQIPSGGYGSLSTSQTKMIVDYVRVYNQLPLGWVSADIGGPGQAGYFAANPASGTWTVAGGGTDIWGPSDQFQLAAETWVGDGSVVARVNSLQNTDPWAKAGVMVRSDTSASSAFADVLATPGNGVSFQWRDLGGDPAQSVTLAGITAPVWVQLVRSGNNFSASYSSNGVSWTPVGTPQTLQVSRTARAGLAVTAHNNDALTTATFSHVSVLPADWAASDIGAPALPGSSVFDPASGTWTVSGGGADIWNNSDQFQLASQPFAGDGILQARVTSVPNTNVWAKAGVMFRDSTAADAAFADVLVTPGSGVSFQWRSAAGGTPQSVTVAGVAAPAWVQLVRSGDSFSASYSTDGSTWTPIGSAQTIVMNPTAQAGLAVTAHNNGVLNTSTFTNVSLLPPAWTDADIGAPGKPGGAVVDGTTWTVRGGGADIWGTADQFHFVSVPFANVGGLVAEVTGIQNTDPWAKAGVMVRDSADPGAPFADMLATSGQGVSFQWRSTAGTLPSSVTIPGVTAPVWVRLVRIGDAFSGYYRTDGGPWTQVGTTQTVVLSTPALAGLVVTAHNNGLLNTAIFDHVAGREVARQPTAPEPVGLPTPDASLADGGPQDNGTVTVVPPPDPSGMADASDGSPQLPTVPLPGTEGANAPLPDPVDDQLQPSAAGLS